MVTVDIMTRKNTVGVMDRNPSSNPTEVYEFVAYKYNNKNSTLITGVEFQMICLNLWICQIAEE